MGLVQHGAEEGSGHLTVQRSGFGEGIKGMGTGSCQHCPEGGWQTVASPETREAQAGDKASKPKSV